MKKHNDVSLLAALLGVVFASESFAQGTAFTYQGRLTDNGNAYTGNAEFQATLWDAVSGGSQIAANSPTLVVVGVTNGLFTLPLDFGDNFPGADRWLQLEVKTAIGPFTLLSPRQKFTPTPYAINAFNALTVAAGTISDPGFIGTTDEMPLELYVNNQRGLRLEPGTNSVNIVLGWSGNSVAAGVIGATIGGGGASGNSNTNWVEEKADFSTISGGEGNSIGYFAQFATVAGGFRNVLGSNTFGCVISGGINHSIGYLSQLATIGGGNGHEIQSSCFQATISGGNNNTIESNSGNAVISGGANNVIQSNALGSTISGGEFNTVSLNADRGSIGGGGSHTIHTNADYGTIGGGLGNTIHRDTSYATIGGGLNNTIQRNAIYATIPGGSQNSATNYAFAAGYRAKANHTGSFVWGDSGANDIASASANSVTMRASGGYRLFSNSGTTAGVSLAAGGGSWTSISDRNAKENFSPVDTQAVLAKVAELPLTTWNYKSQKCLIRHMGPMAQDFQAAFGLGETDTGIASVDADGVALAAIQGLNHKMEMGSRKAEDRNRRSEARSRKLEERLELKETEITELKEAVNELKELVQTMNAKLNRGAQ